MADALKTAREAALDMLSRKPYSRAELLCKLTERFDEAQAVDAIAYLEGIGYLNDLEYAKAIVRRYAAKAYGRARIKNELYRRKIPRELWDAALEDMPEQDSRIDALLAKRLGGGGYDKAGLRRASEYLFRRGFSWDEINESIERLKVNGD